MSTIHYTRDHEWLRVEANGEVTVGITPYAQEQLGDIVYVELPAVGQAVGTDANAVVIESVKAVGEVKLPFAGTVTAVNEALADQPELLNREPLAGGWLLRCAPTAALNAADFLDAAAYEAWLATL